MVARGSREGGMYMQSTEDFQGSMMVNFVLIGIRDAQEAGKTLFLGMSSRISLEEISI